MASNKFIQCRDCAEIHHVSEFDKAPSYAWRGGESIEQPENDLRDFMNRHAGHHLEPLRSVGEAAFPEGCAADPLAVAYLRMTDEREEFLVRRYREHLNDPLKFERVPGRLTEPLLAVEIQDREIRRELRRECAESSRPGLTDDRIDLFIELFHKVVDGFDLRRVDDDRAWYRDANTSYAGLEPTVQAALLEQCRSCFDAAEMEILQTFVMRHSDAPDVMTLVLRRQRAVEQHT